MQFMVIGQDYSDKEAFDRRMAARDAHLKSGAALYEQGKWLYAAGLLDNDGKLIGSMIVCEFPDREALDKEWLNNEPYVTGEVWETVVVTPAQVAPFCS